MAMTEAPVGFANESSLGDAGFDGSFDGAVDCAPQRAAALGVSIFADRAHLRAELVEDAVTAGLARRAVERIRQLA